MNRVVVVIAALALGGCAPSAREYRICQHAMSLAKTSADSTIVGGMRSGVDHSYTCAYTLENAND